MIWVNWIFRVKNIEGENSVLVNDVVFDFVIIGL